MIKYLQGLKKRRGFTMVELIIVIAIIAVLTAITIPLFSNDDAKVQSANIYANDFYTALQYTMTRYQTTDYYLSPKMQQQDTLIKYDSTNFGNRLGFDSATGNSLVDYLYIEAKVDNGIEYVHVSALYNTLMTQSESDPPSELARLLKEDLSGIINQSNKGYYYAIVDEDSYHNLKVLCVNYCEGRLTVSGTTDDYLDSIMFVDYGILGNGLIAGTCSSCKDSTGRYLGDIGTYICGLGNESGGIIYKGTT